MAFLAYTDNLVLMDKSNNGLKLKFVEFENKTNNIELQSNKDKKEYMIIGGRDGVESYPFLK